MNYLACALEDAFKKKKLHIAACQLCPELFVRIVSPY
jgi:hypothetical protein